jgi:hypothetical protein
MCYQSDPSVCEYTLSYGYVPVRYRTGVTPLTVVCQSRDINLTQSVCFHIHSGNGYVPVRYTTGVTPLTPANQSCSINLTQSVCEYTLRYWIYQLDSQLELPLLLL